MHSIRDTFTDISIQREDAPAIETINSVLKNSASTKKYLEVGAGLGRFPLKLRSMFPKEKLAIECLEINEAVAKKLESHGFKTVCASATKMPYEDNSFDIVHCSHVIEHFSYPDVTSVLEELFRVVKPNGFVIIRSPLMYRGFYNELDHIKPYPPKAIMHYFSLEQQQKKGAYEVSIVRNWTRREAIELPWRIPGTVMINRILMVCWNLFNWPTAQPNGYVATFTKS